MPTFEAGGASLYYEVHGEGPALVFAHGAGGSHLSWWQQVPVFRDSYTCVTFDHRGFGQSFDDRPMLERPTFIEDLASLLDHLDIQEARLVAQSMGGMACIGLAAAEPQRVKAVVMADTAGGLTSPELMEARAAVAKAREGQDLLSGALGGEFRASNPAGSFLYAQVYDLNPPRPADFLEGRDRVAVDAAAAATIQQPVLFIEGSDDVLIPPHVIEMAAAMLPNARIALVPGAGHSVYFEKPERFNELLAAFLAEVDG